MSDSKSALGDRLKLLLEMEPSPTPATRLHLPPGSNLERPELNTEGQPWMTLSPGLPGQDPAVEHGLLGQKGGHEGAQQQGGGG